MKYCHWECRRWIWEGEDVIEWIVIDSKTSERITWAMYMRNDWSCYAADESGFAESSTLKGAKAILRKEARREGYTFIKPKHKAFL